MIVPFEGKTPQIADSAWLAPGATIIGDVVIGERCSVWPGAVIRGDYAPIRIGTDVNVQDNVCHPHRRTADHRQRRDHRACGGGALP